jgi:hypothetical protein
MDLLLISLLIATFGLVLQYASGTLFYTATASRLLSLILFGYILIVACTENLTPSLQLFEQFFKPAGIVIFGVVALFTVWNGVASIRALWLADNKSAKGRLFFVLTLYCVVIFALLVREFWF